MKEDKRKEIRELVTKLFVEKGFENTTTRDIASVAGISNSALYYYFDSKEDLLYQILDETISTGLVLIRKIDDSGKSVKEKLTSVLDIYTKYYTVDTDKMRLLVHDQKSLTPEHKETLREKQKDYMKVVVKILDELKESKEILDLDTTVCAFAFFGMVHWAYRWYNPKGRLSPEKLSEIFKRIFTEGIYSDYGQHHAVDSSKNQMKSGEEV